MTNNQLATQTKRDITTDPSSLTGADIKKYFDPQNLLTEKQIGQALALCKGRNLNPFANEVYIVAVSYTHLTLPTRCTLWLTKIVMEAQSSV